MGETQAEDSGHTDELDYKAFKTYLLAPSPESHQKGFLKSQSSIRISEYKAFESSSALEIGDQGNINSGTIRKLEMERNISANCYDLPQEYSCDGRYPFSPLFSKPRLIFLIEDVEFKLKIESENPSL